MSLEATSQPSSTGPSSSSSAGARRVGRAPDVAAAPPRAWLGWLEWLLGRGRATIAALGIVLAAGFALGVGALLLFATLANEVLERDSVTVDQNVLVTLQSHANPVLDHLAFGLSWLGAEGLAVLFFAVLVWLAWKRRFGAAISLALVVIWAQLLNDVLKELFHRPRPVAVITSLPGQAWSFPSGHAMVSLAFYGFLAYLGWRLLHGRWRVACVAALVTLVLLIGLSRMYLAVHYFTDVVAGYTTGFIWLDSVILGGYLLGRRAKNPGPGSRVQSPRAQVTDSQTATSG